MLINKLIIVNYLTKAQQIKQQPPNTSSRSSTKNSSHTHKSKIIIIMKNNKMNSVPFWYRTAVAFAFTLSPTDRTAAETLHPVKRVRGTYDSCPMTNYYEQRWTKVENGSFALQRVFLNWDMRAQKPNRESPFCCDPIVTTELNFNFCFSSFFVRCFHTFSVFHEDLQSFFKFFNFFKFLILRFMNQFLFSIIFTIFIFFVKFPICKNSL